MKKVFLSLFCLVLLCGCTVNKPAQIETTPAPDTAAAGELTVRSVWITYYELQAFTGKYDTGGDFYSAASKAFAQLQRRGFTAVTVQVHPCVNWQPVFLFLRKILDHSERRSMNCHN